MEWIIGIIVVVVIGLFVLGQMRRRGGSEAGAPPEQEERLRQEAAERTSEGADSRQEWERIIEAHPETRSAFERLRPFGQTALERLMEHHREHGPERLSEAAEEIARDYEAASDEDKQ